ncbi:MAG: GerMN domain-containing protein [Oscillibacter sp.]
MNKRGMTLLLCAVLLLPGCVYAATAKPENDSYALYFQEADLTQAQGGDALRGETIYLPADAADSAADLAETLLQELLKGPLDETLKSPIPSGTSLLSVGVNSSRATVDLSGAYSTLSGVNLTMADYCIALTLTQLPDIHTVKITVRGQELAYRDHQTFTAADALRSSTEDVVGTVEATLYFPNAGGTLLPEKRTLDLYEGDTQVRAVLKGLQGGPEGKELLSVLPEGFQVKSVWQEGEVCYVNLPSAALENLTEEAALSTALQAVARSLYSIPTVEEVQYLVDGEFTRSYGSVSVAQPYPGK